jgi:hypothetical protein
MLPEALIEASARTVVEEPEGKLLDHVSVWLPKEDLWKVRVGEEAALSITGRVTGLRLARNGAICVDLDSVKVI